jgi:hypothetical protein
VIFSSSLSVSQPERGYETALFGPCAHRALLGRAVDGGPGLRTVAVSNVVVSRRAPFPSGDSGCRFVWGRLGSRALLGPSKGLGAWAGAALVLAAVVVGVGPIAIRRAPTGPPPSPGALLGVAFTRSMLGVLAICQGRCAQRPATNSIASTLSGSSRRFGYIVLVAIVLYSVLNEFRPGFFEAASSAMT